MSTTLSQLVFIDFENVPDIDLAPLEGMNAHVTLLIGKNQKKIDLALVQQIRRFAGQVELVEVGATGRNALDLTLAFYLGRAIERSPAAQCSIVSKDKDFDAMISHLTNQGHKISRCERFGALPCLRKPPAPTAPRSALLPDDKRVKVLARLKNPHTRNRPASLEALRTHIKTSLGKESSEEKAQEIIEQLQAERAIAIDPKGRVTYGHTDSVRKG